MAGRMPESGLRDDTCPGWPDILGSAPPTSTTWLAQTESGSPIARYSKYSKYHLTEDEEQRNTDLVSDGRMLSINDPTSGLRLIDTCLCLTDTWPLSKQLSDSHYRTSICFKWWLQLWYYDLIWKYSLQVIKIPSFDFVFCILSLVWIIHPVYPEPK